MSNAGAVSAERQVTIIVNGREREFAGKEISFRQVVDLAFTNAWTDPNTIYTVSFTHGDSAKPQGTLVDGQSVKVKKDMVFNVTPTNRS